MVGYKPTVMTMRFVPLSQEHKEITVNLLHRLTASGNSDCHIPEIIRDSYELHH